MPATAMTTSAPSISSRRESRRRTPATPTSGTSVEETPRYSSVRRASSATDGVGGAGRDHGDRPLDPRHRLPDREMQRGGARIVVGAARQRRGRDLLPHLRRQARDQDVVGAGELAADLGDLGGRLPLGEDDLGEPDAPEPIEVERVVGAPHWPHSMRRFARPGSTRYGRRPSALFESFGQGKRVKIPRGPRHCHRGRLGQQSTGRVRSGNRLRVREGARRRRIRKPGDLPDDTLLGRGHTRETRLRIPGARDALSIRSRDSVSSNGRFE